MHYKLPDDSTRYACASRNSMMLQFVMSQGCAWDRYCWFEAGGVMDNTAMLTYMLNNGCPKNKDAWKLAANRGLIENLKFFHLNDFPKDDADVWYWAVQNDSLEAMKLPTSEVMANFIRLKMAQMNITPPNRKLHFHEEIVKMKNLAAKQQQLEKRKPNEKRVA